jgi:hypothetical protein
VHRVHVVAPGAEPIVLAGEAAHVAYLGDGRLVLATAQGVRVHAATGDGPSFGSVPGGASVLATRASWIATAYPDGSVWRLDVATGAADHASTGDVAPSALAITDDGTVLLAAGKDLRAWRTTGGTVTLAQLERPIHELHAIAGNRAIALTDLSAYAFDLVPGHKGITIPASGATAVADDAGLVVVRTSAGLLEVIDAFSGADAGVRWTLARAPDVTFGAPRISRDGHRVLASTAAGLLVWTLDLPATAEATAAWLATLTAPARIE